MIVLVVNCGSSSLKFSLIDAARRRALATGLASGLGDGEPRFEARVEAGPASRAARSLAAGSAHAAALDAMARWIGDRAKAGALPPLEAVGHRVVHGGEAFQGPARIDAAALARIEARSHLAPLHNPANLEGIRLCLERYPEAPQVAVFDTSFHQTLPPKAYRYALPERLYREREVRRYGFHGASHQHAAEQTSRRLEGDGAARPTALIVAHLGNGCSLCAALDGKSVDTTMGLTPLEGLVMGTRSGDVDPGLHAFLARSADMSLEAIDRLLNRESGLLGLSGESNDMRVLRQLAREGHERARLAVEIFAYRAAKAVASLVPALGRLDALAFTGGIGENDPETRAAIVSQLAFLGLSLDPQANAASGRGREGRLSPPGARPSVWAIRCEEESLIARQTAALLAQSASSKASV